MKYSLGDHLIGKKKGGEVSQFLGREEGAFRPDPVSSERHLTQSVPMGGGKGKKSPP